MANGDNTQATFGLAQIASYLRAAQWRLGEAHGLTPTQISILAVLRRFGASRVQSLADRLGVTHATASDAVSALQAKGMVQKTPDPSDGRAVLIGLTRSGKRVAMESDGYPDALLTAISQLAGEERNALHRSLSKIIRSLQILGLIEPQRLCVTCRFFRPHAHPGSAKPHHCAFVDAAFADASLRMDCSDHTGADDADREDLWTRFVQAPSA